MVANLCASKWSWSEGIILRGLEGRFVVVGAVDGVVVEVGDRNHCVHDAAVAAALPSGESGVWVNLDSTVEVGFAASTWPKRAQAECESGRRWPCVYGNESARWGARSGERNT